MIFELASTEASKYLYAADTHLRSRDDSRGVVGAPRRTDGLWDTDSSTKELAD